jgi:hypothetical protein
MAVTNTSDFLPTGGVSEVAQMTSANGTDESADLIVGHAQGKRIKEIRVFSGQTNPIPAGTVLVLKLFDGTNSRTIGSAICPGGADSLQAFFAFNNLFLPTVAHSFRAQLRTPLASGATLDFTFIGEEF